VSDPTGGGDTQGDETALLICRSLNGLRWPNGGIGTERKFNRACLTEIFHLTPGLEDIEVINQSTIRRSNASPFFGWGASSGSSGGAIVTGRVKTDQTYKKGPFVFFVENKLIKRCRECDVKNALVQAVEYLNLYDVDFGIVLLFDGGRGSNLEWQCRPEEKLIRTLISVYPICVVRVRENEPTISYYCESRINCTNRETCHPNS
jgi:hypothetical protein